MLLWSYMGEGVSDVPWTFLQKFLRTLQYIPHHSSPCHNDICRWLHFASGLDLYRWEPSGGSWWSCLPCNTPIPQTFCQCSWCSHWDHYSMVPLYKTSSEDQRDDGAMPFLDILVTPGRDGSLSTSAYRKPTHTDLYLQWDSHHTLTAKYSVIGTLQHGANTICSNPQLLHKEEQHLKNALKNCKYPTWPLNRIQKKTNNPDRKQALTNRTNNNTQKKSYNSGTIL